MAGASVSLTGITASDPRPGNYLQINFAVGAVGGFQGQRPILLVGNMLATGDATAARLYGPISDPAVQTEDDVIARFGSGSELHRMFLRGQKKNPTTAFWFCAIAPSAGTAATLALTFTGTATAAGTVRVFVGTQFVDVAFASGDTPTLIAAAVVAAVNAKTRWAVTTASAAGVVTFTSKQTGLRGNDLRAFALVLTASGVTSSLLVPTYLAGGTTEDDITAVLATIAPKRFYYIASATNTTGLTALIAQVNQQQLPLTNLRQRVFAGFGRTLSTGITAATALNAARGEAGWLEDSDLTPAEIAADLAAVYALEELSTVPRHNFSGYGSDPDTALIWDLPAPRSGKAPSATSILAALNNGLTPIGVTGQGTTYIVKRITMRSLSGANPDYRIRDAHRVTETDFFADDLLAKLNLQFAGCDLFDDLQSGDEPPTNPRFTCPQYIRNAINALLNSYASAGRMKNVASVKAGMVVQRSTANTNTVEIRIPFENLDILDKTLTALDQVA
jgi:phage tail sheath gpL-like